MAQPDSGEWAFGVPGGGGAQLSGGGASLMELLQQQHQMLQQEQQQAQQQQVQQQGEPQAARGADVDVSLAALLQQQGPGSWAGSDAFAAQQFQAGVLVPQPGAAGPVLTPLPFGGGLPAGLLPPEALQQQAAAAGGAQLPPAILQHQQAAMARSAQPGAFAPAGGGLSAGALGGSGAALGQQPDWALLQQQAAAPPVPLPLLPVPTPAVSTATAATATPAAAFAASGAPRRRGRQPKDPSMLTERQLRAREAQKRFRDKQKRVMAETEAAVQETTAELDRMRVANESQKLKNEVLEQLLKYKEAQVDALEFQKQMDPPPRFVISKDMVDMMRERGIAGLFTPAVLLRYAVAGYTDHMDERGEVKDPPPFEKVAEDWGEIVEVVRSILNAARQNAGGAGEARRPQVVELRSGSASGSAASVGDAHVPAGQQQQAGGGVSTASTGAQREGGGEVAQPPASAAADAATSSAAGGSNGGGAASSGSRLNPSQIPEHVLPEFVAIAEEATDEVLEATHTKHDPIARFVLARILSQTAAHSHLEWETLVDGAVVRDGPHLYRFTGQQLRALANTMRRVGLMLWQQALLFPQHISKLGTLRLDEPANLRVEKQDLDHWRGILRQLHCRPEQLHAIVAGHRRYMERMRPVMNERQEALAEVQRMTDYQMQHMFAASTQEFVTSTTRLTDATGLVMQTISAQHAAYCELLIAIFYALTFPVQRPQLFVLSWPYFPQLELLGRAAALETGADISGYPTYCSEGGGVPLG